MIKYIRFNNFYSYFDETEVSFELNKQATHSAYDFMVETTQDKIRLNKIMAVLGANGSGKTQLLKPLVFLCDFILGNLNHISNKIPYSTFSTKQAENTEFILGFMLLDKDDIYQEYRYELLLNDGEILREALYQKTSQSFSYIFERSYNNKKMNYKHRNFASSGFINNAPPTISLITLANLIVETIADGMIELLRRFQNNFFNKNNKENIINSLKMTTKLFDENPLIKKQAESLLQKFDTGISELTQISTLVLNAEQQQETILFPYCVHKTDDGEFIIPMTEESNGTQSAYNLLGLILPVLQNGGVAIIDELDNDLHPHLLPEIFNLFRSEHTNPHNAQLIFTCHTPEVFNILNKHQIYLVEKINQQSEAWRLDEVEGVRNDDNLYAKYMAGAFSAVPNL